MSKVYFASARLKKETSILDRLGQLMEAAGLEFVKPGALTGVKMSFGERGNTAFLRPMYVKATVDKLKAHGAKPFLTDSNTLYHGSRTDSVEHVSLAIEHGFGFAQTGAPIIMADGLRSDSWVEVDVDLKHFRSVRVGSIVPEMDALVSLAHFKGHLLVGFGGALKNVGMGLGSRTMKQRMHAGTILPVFEKGNKCVACGRCAEVCRYGAVTIDETAVFDHSKCIGCADCISSCPYKCLKIHWNEKPEAVGEKTVETAFGVHKILKGKCLYINVILDVTPDCDCFPFSDAPMVPDVGIVVSRDPVAADMAAADLVNAQESFTGCAIGKSAAHDDKWRLLHPEVDWKAHLRYAESIGLGSCSYELVTL